MLLFPTQSTIKLNRLQEFTRKPNCNLQLYTLSKKKGFTSEILRYVNTHLFIWENQH